GGDVGYGDFLELVAQERGAENGTVTRLLIGRLAGWRADQDRLITVVEGFDVKDRLVPASRAVVAHPFAKRTLDQCLLIAGEAFDRDFGVGRDRQTGDGAANHLDRGTAHAADPVELTHA